MVLSEVVKDQRLTLRRSFYKKQDKLISTFERVHRLHSTKDSDNEDGDGEENSKKDEAALRAKRKRVSLYTKLSLLINVVSIPTSLAHEALVARSVSAHNQNHRGDHFAFAVGYFLRG